MPTINEYKEKYYAALLACLDAVCLSDAHVDTEEDDGLIEQIDAVIAIARVDDTEAEIIASLGVEQGELLILDCLERIVNVERDRDRYFFRERLERLKNLRSIRVLRPTETELEITLSDNGEFEEIDITNADGERIPFVKSGQIRYNGSVYIELSVNDMRKIGRPLCHYLVDQDAGGIVLRLVEDVELSDRLYDIIEHKFY